MTLDQSISFKTVLAVLVAYPLKRLSDVIPCLVFVRTFVLTLTPLLAGKCNFSTNRPLPIDIQLLGIHKWRRRRTIASTCLLKKVLILHLGKDRLLLMR